MNAVPTTRVVIIGAGPAGLTAAYQLCKLDIPGVVLEKDNVVGGISRTVRHDGYHFDIGGHRFFTKIKVVDDLWREILSEDDFLKRGRLSRIYYNKRFFDYPLRPANALLGLGVVNSFLIMASYFYAWLFPIRNEKTFEDWISNRFGRRFFKTFFKTYTEKVWGIPCSKLSADWAAQRIRGLSMKRALKNALFPRKKIETKDVIKTLIDSFHYPKRGPGMMWETAAEKIQRSGFELRMNCNVERILWNGQGITAVEISADGRMQQIKGTHFISSMPLRELVQKLDPRPSEQILNAASRLSYRDFLTVALVVDKPDLFPDNWIYIHDSHVKVGRIQNFKNWSPFMVPDPQKSCIGLEYFCYEGDGLWNMSDEALIELGKRELEALRLGKAMDVVNGAVVRMPKAYPIYDMGYGDAVNVVRGFLDGVGNIYPVGRNGMHKYNNQDHSMLTAMLAVENISGAKHNIWAVNDEQDYHEESRASDDKLPSAIRDLASTQPQVPIPIDDAAFGILRHTFGRVHAVALGTSLGTVGGMYLFMATMWLLLTGGSEAGAILQLLGQYFIGFTFSWPGAFIGLFYGFVFGFITGWSIATLRNIAVKGCLYLIKLMEEVGSLEDR